VALQAKPLPIDATGENLKRFVSYWACTAGSSGVTFFIDARGEIPQEFFIPSFSIEPPAHPAKPLFIAAGGETPCRCGCFSVFRSRGETPLMFRNEPID
jgi:hypothetical protein